MNDQFPPMLSLDGVAIRRIREEKKLTQLYVAKVVGVTTDTVSRWENNRYPSIKRENGMRLAEALEVPLAEILQRPEESSPPAAPAAKPWWLVGLALAALGIAAFLFFSGRREMPVPGVAAERFLPPHAAPGSILPVRVRLQVEGEGKGFILREHFPPGWILAEASPPPSSIDNGEGTARWIIRSGEPQTIAYLLKIPKNATAGLAEEFRGEVVAGSGTRHSPAPVAGGSRLLVSPFLWADQNRDYVIDDGEMLQASYLFDEMGGVALDWKHLEAIWDAGSYRWDPERQVFTPLRLSSP